jgi:hypothetical protein
MTKTKKHDPKATAAAILAKGYASCGYCGTMHRATKCPVCATPRPNGAETISTPGNGDKVPYDGSLPMPKSHQPNKTEARYNRERLAGKGKYEALSFRMANGHRYTPDWYEPETATVHEVKGAYKFGSHGRARLAFDQCRAEFPQFRFVWATWKKGQWEVEQ